MTDDLTRIGTEAGTDKATWHGYTKYYHEILKPFRRKKLFLLELGFGGYEWADTGGESARMWAEYGPKWDVVAVDVHHKDNVPEGVSFYEGSQDDIGLLGAIIDNHGRPTIIVDDASHDTKLTISSFDILWPTLKPGGWYIVEDIGTSYFGDYNGHYKGGPGTAVHDLGKNFIDNIMANSRFGKEHNILSGTQDIGIDVLYVMPNAIGIRKR